MTKCFRETLVVWSLFYRQTIKQKSQIHLPSSVLLWTCLATSVLRQWKIFKILSCQLYFHKTNYTLKLDLFTRHNTFWKSVSSSPVLKATIRDTIQKVKLLLSTPILLQNWKIVALQMNKTKLTISLEDEVTFCVPQNKMILRFKCFLSENLAKKMDFCVLFVYIIIDKF